MNVKISKWGNSLAVRIPSSIARSAHLREGIDLEIKEDGPRIVLEPSAEKKYSLEALLSGLEKENLHAEVETTRMGSEEW